MKVYSLMTYPSIDEPINVQVFGDIMTALSEVVSTLEEWVGESTSTFDHSTNVSDMAEIINEEHPNATPYEFYEMLLAWAKEEPRWDGQWIELQSHDI